MTELKLKEYFENSLTAQQLADNLKDNNKMANNDVIAVYINMILYGEFEVTKDHILKLCDDTQKGHFSENDLNSIAFSLMCSDLFCWDNETSEGRVIADVIFDWENPDVNFPVTNDNLTKWKDYLLTGNYQLE